MQNPIQKFRQSSNVFEKPDILPEKLKNDELQLPHSRMLFAEILCTSPTYQCLKKDAQDFFYFV